jgi:hypothetical protein
LNYGTQDEGQACADELTFVEEIHRATAGGVNEKILYPWVFLAAPSSGNAGSGAIFPVKPSTA